MIEINTTNRKLELSRVGLAMLLRACGEDPRLVEFAAKIRTPKDLEESLQFAREYIFSKKSHRATVSN